ALDAVEPALRVERDRAGAARVGNDRPLLAGRIELANRVGLLLREDHAAVGRAVDAVGRLEVGPDELPLRTWRYDARDAGDIRFALAGQQRLRSCCSIQERTEQGRDGGRACVLH